MSQHTQIDGIELWATQSYFSSQTNSTNHRKGIFVPFNIVQRAFTYEDSTTTGEGPQGEYLSVKLDTLGVGSDQDEKNNCIIVSGMAAREAGQVTPSLSIGEDVIRFEHVFVTNFQRETLNGDFVHYLWDFEDQTANTSTPYASNEWSPSGTHSGWANGSNAVNGSNWEGANNVHGFTCNNTSTPSGGTGPDGGMGGNNPFTNNPTVGLKYVYRESTGRYDGQFVMRLPGINFSELMSSTSNNLDLDFYSHNYGNSTANDNMRCRVYIDTNPTSNHSNATLLYTKQPMVEQSTSDDKYNHITGTSATISLNAYRTVDATHYIYIVVDGATGPSSIGYKSDVALDYFSIIEDNYHDVKRETSFTQDLRSGVNGTLILSSSVDYVSTNADKRVDPTIKFRLFSRDGVDLYVKGTYLLM